MKVEEEEEEERKVVLCKPSNGRNPKTSKPRVRVPLSVALAERDEVERSKAHGSRS